MPSGIYGTPPATNSEPKSQALQAPVETLTGGSIAPVAIGHSHPPAMGIANRLRRVDGSGVVKNPGANRDTLGRRSNQWAIRMRRNAIP